MIKKIKIILVLLIVIVIILSISFFNNLNTLETIAVKKDFNSILTNLNVSFANIDSFLIYGTHLNIKGNIDITPLEETKIDTLSIVLKSQDLEEIEYPVNYDISNNKLNFYVSNNINDGIYLDNIEENNYIVLLKMSYLDETCKYYSFNEFNTLKDLQYYTISNNNKTKELLFNYIYNSVSYISLNISNVTLPDNVYDITIDAGHGGKDSGATNGTYYESDIVLDYSIELKKILELSGLKVLLTRESDEYVEEYGENGRAILPNAVKSKYTFSLHLNSNEEDIVNGGIEIYCPNNCNTSFAKLLADNIVSYTGINYSGNTSYQIDKGVYVKNFTLNDITEAAEYAKKLGYEEYDITQNTPYLFMIRETGGKSTNAYIDGRNTLYGDNIYNNSIIGNESYLLELGYINCTKDLNSLISNKANYLKAINESILYLINNRL